MRRALLVPAAIACAAAATVAQQESFSSGQNIAPVYEGWEQHADGSFTLVLGYFNRNWEEVIDLPVGADNAPAPVVPAFTLSLSARLPPVDVSVTLAGLHRPLADDVAEPVHSPSYGPAA